MHRLVNIDTAILYKFHGLESIRTDKYTEISIKKIAHTKIIWRFSYFFYTLSHSSSREFLRF